MRGLWKAKHMELFKPWFTLLRGNHINPFHNGACDSDDCFHSKRRSFYHCRIMINKSTDCFGHTYWCLYSLNHTPRFFSPTKFHIILFFPPFFLFFFLLSFQPAYCGFWLMKYWDFLFPISSAFFETMNLTFTDPLKAYFYLLDIFVQKWTTTPSLLLVRDFREPSNWLTHLTKSVILCLWCLRC